MSDQVGNPKDRFSHKEAHIEILYSSISNRLSKHGLLVIQDRHFSIDFPLNNIAEEVLLKLDLARETSVILLIHQTICYMAI